MKAVPNIIQERRLLEEVRLFLSTFLPHLPTFPRSTILSLSIYATPSKTTRIVSSSSTSCWVVIYAVCPFPSLPSPTTPRSLLPSPSRAPRFYGGKRRPLLRRPVILWSFLHPRHGNHAQVSMTAFFRISFILTPFFSTPISLSQGHQTRQHSPRRERQCSSN